MRARGCVQRAFMVQPRLPHARANGYKPRSLRAFAIPKDDLMAIERTFSIIKPDATARNLTGAINAMIEQAGLRIVAQKRVKMTSEQAETFYAIHRQRPFFGELVAFMTSGPVVVQVLEGDNAVAAYRDIMGATDPGQARDHSQGARKIDRRELGAWLRCPGNRRDGNRAVFCRQRDRRLRP